MQYNSSTLRYTYRVMHSRRTHARTDDDPIPASHRIVRRLLVAGHLVFRGGAPPESWEPRTSEAADVERATHSFLAVPPEPGESHSVRSDRVTLHLRTPQLVFASPLLRIRRGMPAVCFVTAPQAIHGCPIEDSDWAHPLPHLHRGWAHPSTPVLGQGLPYHICTGTGARPGIMIVGTLWLFPGAIAHLVMRTVVPAGAPASEEPRPRISVAVNYTLAPHPAPHSAPFCAFESETHSDTSCAAECRAG